MPWGQMTLQILSKLPPTLVGFVLLSPLGHF